MSDMITAIAVVKSIILLLGSAITYISLKAYRRVGDPSLGILGAGFGVITLGALLTGIANQFFSVSLEMGVLVNSIFVAVGLAIILYSVYIQR